MENDLVPKKKSKKKADILVSILMLQFVAVGVFLVLAFGIKIVGGTVYSNIRGLYYSAINDTTKVSEVIDIKEDSDFNEKIQSNLNSQDSTDDRDNLKTDEKNIVSQPNSSEIIELVPEDEAKHSSAEPIDNNGYIFDFNTIRQNMNASITESTSLSWPITGIITSEFGYRNDPINGEYAMHGGIDIARPSGTNILAAQSGTVIEVGYNAYYGNYIIIEHSAALKTLYAHCSTVTVAQGTAVKKGNIIATVGSTGRSTGPHLHFETRVNDYKVNPKSLLDEMVQL